MKTTLEPTGERMIENAYQHSLGAYVIYLLHAASYRFAEPYCAGKRLLDLGCGSGYGSAQLAKIAADVQGVDVSNEAVQYAANTYPRENLHFSTIVPDTKLPFEDQAFDVVISFQVIEHVVDHHHYLQEAYRVLKPGGLLLLITPDRKNRLLPFQKPWNRWHLREYDTQTLTTLVAQYFKIENAFEMGARQDVADVELKRYRRLKWVTLPFTLPIFPDFIRVACLNLLHAIKGEESNAHTQEKMQFDFGIEVVDFKPSNPNSLNVVIVAKKL